MYEGINELVITHLRLLWTKTVFHLLIRGDFGVKLQVGISWSSP